MASIYNISAWTTSTYYRKNSVVSANGLYYYALVNHTSSATGLFQDSYSANTWGGVGVDDVGNAKPSFFWKPSYDLVVKQDPRIKSIKFGDGYEQRVKDGINNMLIAVDASFDDIDLDEAT